MTRRGAPSIYRFGSVSRLTLYACIVPLAGCGGGSAGASPASVASTPVAVIGPVASPAPTPTPIPTPSPAATPTPVASPTLTATSARPQTVIVAEGDSISVFWAGNHTGIFAGKHPSVIFHGTAVGGSRINVRAGTNGLVQRTDADLALRPTVLTVLIGANDLGDGNYPSAQAWLDKLWGYVAVFKAQNIKVAVGTVLPICVPQSPSYNNSHAERRPIVNEAIRRAVGSKIDAVIDYAADPTIGPDAAACDTKLFYDGLHPTDGRGGQGVMAQVYTRAVEELIAR